MSFLSQVFFDNSNSITISLDSLGNGSIAESSTIDNSTDKFMAADIQLVIVTGGTVDTTGTVTLSLLRSVDGGSTFDDHDKNNAEILAIFNANETNETYTFSADTSRLGILPSHFEIAVTNNSGGTLAGSGNSATYAGKKFEIV